MTDYTTRTPRGILLFVLFLLGVAALILGGAR
jgi:hypothetical protein